MNWTELRESAGTTCECQSDAPNCSNGGLAASGHTLWLASYTAGPEIFESVDVSRVGIGGGAVFPNSAMEEEVLETGGGGVADDDDEPLLRSEGDPGAT